MEDSDGRAGREMDWLLPVAPTAGDPDSFEVIPSNEILGTFGSFLMACAVRAGAATTEGMRLNALHAVFLMPPAAGPIRFEVERTRSGRLVSVRRIAVAQEAAIRAVITLSFQASSPEAPNWEQAPVATGATPESLPRHETSAAGLAVVDLRPLHPVPPGYNRIHPYWARPAESFGAGPVAAAAAVALASDHFVTALATPPGEGPPSLSVTLDHSLWLHRPTAADDWLLYDADLLTVAEGRALVRGTVHDRGGRLVASFVQNALRRSSRPYLSA